MRIQITRINYNHCKGELDQHYLAFSSALKRCVVASFAHLHLLDRPSTGLVFEDEGLHRLWVGALNCPHSEAIITTLQLESCRGMFVEMLLDLEGFYHHKYPFGHHAVYVQVTIDPTYHLCIQLRHF